MLVTVFHKEYDQNDNKVFNKMCVVKAPFESVDENLEYAWRYTNNIKGSWSRNDIGDNADWNEDVIEIAPLEGEYGHRSSMVRDRFEINNELYEVDAFGFSKI